LNTSGSIRNAKATRGWLSFFGTTLSRWRVAPPCPVRSLVFEETLAALASEVARLEHLDQQRRGPVLRILRAFVQHLHDRQLDVEADQVAQGERADRMVAAELHRLVDLLSGSQT